MEPTVFDSRQSALLGVVEHADWTMDREDDDARPLPGDGLFTPMWGAFQRDGRGREVVLCGRTRRSRRWVPPAQAGLAT